MPASSCSFLSFVGQSIHQPFDPIPLLLTTAGSILHFLIRDAIKFLHEQARKMEIGAGPSKQHRLARAALWRAPTGPGGCRFRCCAPTWAADRALRGEDDRKRPILLAATSSAAGLPSMRPMGRLPRGPGDDDWTIQFVTDGRSRKAADIRRAPEVALLFQRDADDAYVALTGAARLLTRESEVRGAGRTLTPVLPHRDRPGKRGFPRGRGPAPGALDPGRHAGAVRTAGTTNGWSSACDLADLICPGPSNSRSRHGRLWCRCAASKPRRL